MKPIPVVAPRVVLRLSAVVLSSAALALSAADPTATEALSVGSAPHDKTQEHRRERILMPVGFDRRAFERASAAMPTTPRPMPGAVALIIPHHWVAADLIVAALRDLRAGREISRVVLLGPDHHNVNQAPGATSERRWSTPCGAVHADRTGVGVLAATGLVRCQPPLLAREHSVSGLVPALGCLMPRTRVVPLSVRNDGTAAECLALGAALSRLAGPDTVIILSADFSHGLSPHEARRRDQKSIAALSDLDSSAISRFDATYLDARGALQVVAATVERLGATDFVMRARSDSSRMPGYAGGPVTSYVVGYYRAPR